MIRVAIADDHAIVRTGLKQIFSMTPDIQVAAEAENVAQLVDALRNTHVDLLLLDLNMPGASGVDMVEHLRARWHNLPILVLSMHNEPQIVTGALRAGANGYVTKDGDLNTLVPAIRIVANKGTYLGQGLADKIVFYETPNSQRSPHRLFTKREHQVFQLLVRGHTINDIAEQLFISNKTVSTHKVRLFQKIGCTTMADLMRYAMQHDLVN